MSMPEGPPLASPLHPSAVGSRLLVLGGGCLLLAALLLLGLATGPSALDPWRIPGLLLDWLAGTVAPAEAGAAAIVAEIRLPRVLLGAMAGVALALSGATLQTLFRNPLADPALIGVTSGGALGAILSLVVGRWLPLPAELLSFGLLPLCAMGGSLLATGLIYQFSKAEGRTRLETLLLMGMAVNAFAGAIIGGLVYFASEWQLRQFAFWTLGSLSGARWPAVAVCALVLLLALAWLPRQARALNVFALGEAEAYHLGVPVQRVKHRLLLLGAVLVGVVTAFCGVIGFVGLVVPHVVRLLVGADHRWVLPGSALMGAALVLAADLLARHLSFAEMPIGTVTALLGAPLFLFLLRRQIIRT